MVTGGAGFVGSHLVDALCKNDHEVIVVDDLSGGQREFVNDDATFVQQDIRGDLSSVIQKKVDVVFHLAAQASVRSSLKDPLSDASVNIGGTLSVLEFAIEEDVDQLLFFSTGGAIYDPNASLPHTESSPVNPLSPYGLSKHTAERYLQRLVNDSIVLTILRPSNIYGPRQGAEGEAGVIAIFARHAIAGKQLEIYGDGEQTRDFVYVDDVVRAAQLLMQQQKAGVYNISTGTQTSVNELAEAMQRAIKRELVITHAEPVPGEVRHSVLSSEKLQQASDWAPAVDISPGIQHMLDYVRNNDR